MTNKTPAEILALDYLLSDYPKDLDFSAILELIDNSADTVTPWQPFENFDPLDLSAELESLKSNAQAAIIQTQTNKRTREQAEIIRDLLEGKKAEILNYDIGEDWAQSTLDAIQNELDHLDQ
jgi:hypothetical protein